MLAALKNLDYPAEKLAVNFAVTIENNQKSQDWVWKLHKLVDLCQFPYQTKIHVTRVTAENQTKWNVYSAVLKNLTVLRELFLKSDCDYYMTLGGDNPPPRNAIKRLLALNVDLASALVHQPPAKNFLSEKWVSFPLVFPHIWHLKDLEHNGLNPEQKRLLRKAWCEVGFQKAIWEDPNWKQLEVIKQVSFGDACCLFKRQVYEKVEPRMLHGTLYMSPDLQFCQDVLAAGFTTACDMKLHCPHFMEDGLAY